MSIPCVKKIFYSALSRDELPEEEHDACTFVLLFLVTCPTKCCNPVAGASFLERDKGRVQLRTLHYSVPNSIREVSFRE
jgi:hypothetical protein